ncbi:hypothetical protein OAK17_01070 [Alphaproteobacteria bacterium]|nr:hypothetical protein [Alphaproteobacteria bacterium]
MNYINFIQSQWLEWTNKPLFPHLNGAKYKLLNFDQISEEVSALIFYPKGFALDNYIVDSFHQEFYVLDGEIVINGVTFINDCYSFMPIGFEINQAYSNTDTVILTFFKINETFSANEKIQKDYSHLWVPRINSYNSTWKNSYGNYKILNSSKSKSNIKILRKNKFNESETLLVGIPPIWLIPSLKFIKAKLEIFLIYGKIKNKSGEMFGGAYMCYNSDISSSVMGNLESAVFLLRCSKSYFNATSGSDEKFNFLDNKEYDCIFPDWMQKKFICGPYAR